MDIYDRIERLLAENNMKQADLAKATGISTGLISQWKSRAQRPSAKKLQVIADHFGVSVDYLLNGESVSREDVTFDDFTYALHRQTRELTEENKQKLLEMAKFFKSQQDKERK